MIASDLKIPQQQLHSPGALADRSEKTISGGFTRTAIQRGTILISNEAPATVSAPTAPLDKELSSHVGSVLRELNTVRLETQRLLEQRRVLEVYLAALKTELETMRAEKVQLMAERIQIAPDTASEANDLDLVGTPLPTPATTRVARPTPGPEHRSPLGGPSPVDEDAFKAFLQADEDHDKSREWFMSKAV